MAKKNLSRKELEELKKKEEIEKAAEVGLIASKSCEECLIGLLKGLWRVCGNISRGLQQSEQSMG